MKTLSRRDGIKAGSALTILAFLELTERAMGLPKADAGGELLPFLDVQPDGKGLKWQNLENWITPNAEVFAVSHYGQANVDSNTWKLEVGGLVKKPRSYTLEEIKKRKKKEIIATLECSGNSSSPGFSGAIGNIRWTGTSLNDLLKEAEPYKRGVEVVFYGADEKIETIRDKQYLQNFARALSVQDTQRDEIILAYEMNGEPLTKEHGAPVRLVVPGYFGIAWVKWLERIEVLDRRFMGKWMAREYVTIRGDELNGQTIWRETSVGPIDVKSVTARALRMKDGTVRLSGAAWTDGTPLKRVEVKIDDGEWQPAQIETGRQSKYAWKFWNYDWKNAPSGEHTIVSRAIDAEGRYQPAKEDPEIQLKKTYWEANQQWVRRIKV